MELRILEEGMADGEQHHSNTATFYCRTPFCQLNSDFYYHECQHHVILKREDFIVSGVQCYVARTL